MKHSLRHHFRKGRFLLLMLLLGAGGERTFAIDAKAFAIVAGELRTAGREGQIWFQTHPASDPRTENLAGPATFSTLLLRNDGQQQQAIPASITNLITEEKNWLVTNKGMTQKQARFALDPIYAYFISPVHNYEGKRFSIHGLADFLGQASLSDPSKKRFELISTEDFEALRKHLYPRGSRIAALPPSQTQSESSQRVPPKENLRQRNTQERTEPSHQAHASDTAPQTKEREVNPDPGPTPAEREWKKYTPLEDKALEAKLKALKSEDSPTRAKAITELLLSMSNSQMDELKKEVLKLEAPEKNPWGLNTTSFEDLKKALLVTDLSLEELREKLYKTEKDKDFSKSLLASEVQRRLYKNRENVSWMAKSFEMRPELALETLESLDKASSQQAASQIAQLIQKMGGQDSEAYKKVKSDLDTQCAEESYLNKSPAFRRLCLSFNAHAPQNEEDKALKSALESSHTTAKKWRGEFVDWVKKANDPTLESGPSSNENSRAHFKKLLRDHYDSETVADFVSSVRKKGQHRYASMILRAFSMEDEQGNLFAGFQTTDASAQQDAQGQGFREPTRALYVGNISNQTFSDTQGALDTFDREQGLIQREDENLIAPLTASMTNLNSLRFASEKPLIQQAPAKHWAKKEELPQGGTRAQLSSAPVWPGNFNAVFKAPVENHIAQNSELSPLPSTGAQETAGTTLGSSHGSGSSQTAAADSQPESRPQHADPTSSSHQRPHVNFADRDKSPSSQLSSNAQSLVHSAVGRCLDCHSAGSGRSFILPNNIEDAVKKVKADFNRIDSHLNLDILIKMSDIHGDLDGKEKQALLNYVLGLDSDTSYETALQEGLRREGLMTQDKTLPQLISAQREQAYRSIVPKTGNPVLDALVQSPDTKFYDDSVPYAYQEPTVGNDAGGMRISNADTRRQWREVIGTDGKLKGVLGNGFGLEETPVGSYGTFKFMHLPKDKNGKTIPLATWNHRNPNVPNNPNPQFVDNDYPIGTVLGEAVYLKNPKDGYADTVELRIRRKAANGQWQADVYRPFDSSEALAQAIKGQENWKQDEELRRLVDHLENPNRFETKTISDNYTRRFLQATGGQDKLPPIAPEKVAKLIRSRPLSSVLNKVWDTGYDKNTGKPVVSYAPSSSTEYGIAPQDFGAHPFPVTSDSCKNCHDRAGENWGNIRQEARAYNQGPLGRERRIESAPAASYGHVAGNKNERPQGYGVSNERLAGAFSPPIWNPSILSLKSEGFLFRGTLNGHRDNRLDPQTGKPRLRYPNLPLSQIWNSAYRDYYK